MTSISELYECFLAHPTITTDSRNCPEGSIFFALRGEKFDGNTYALVALEKGCAYAVVDDAQLGEKDARVLVVNSVLESLQELARHHRRALKTPIIQITGTNGKTTTKELLAAVLAEKHKVLWTEGNLNNHIGVPLTLLRLRTDHELAVIETGANHAGEIALLSRIVEPDCGLITNVGAAHLEGFGSLEGVVKAKCELYEHLRRANKQLERLQKAGDAEAAEEAPRFVFVDGDNATLLARTEGIPSLRYGSPNKGYIVEGEVVSCNPFLQIRYREQEGAWHKVQTKLIGAYNLQNLLAAITVGLTFRVPFFAIDRALTAYTPRNQRSEFRQTEHNRLIVDAYNANLSSMTAAIDNFSQIAEKGKVMVLGEMRELGKAAAEAHQQVAQQAAEAGCEELWLVGADFAEAAAALKKERGRKAPRIRHFANVDAVKKELTAKPMVEKFVLIKGSNGTRLFELAEVL